MLLGSPSHTDKTSHYLAFTACLHGIQHFIRHVQTVQSVYLIRHVQSLYFIRYVQTCSEFIPNVCKTNRTNINAIETDELDLTIKQLNRFFICL